MYYFTKYIYQIMDQYRGHVILYDTVPIGFTGAASERLAPILTDEISADALFFAAHVNFTNANALVRIRSISPQYDWMANQTAVPQDTPISAIAGVSTQAMPVLPLVQPFFVKAAGRIQMIFTNSAAAPTTGGTWTWHVLKLLDPIGSGWDYNVGYHA
jgi:hypothetical protein